MPSTFPSMFIEHAANYFDAYADALRNAMATADRAQFLAASELLEEVMKNGGRVFVCGNGGSAAIANHLVCDHMKGARANSTFHARVTSLSSNIEILTAIANDLAYDKVFEFQLSCEASANDALIAISSSGNSPNIINALNWARSHGIASIAMTGFGGGEARRLADISLHVAADNYGIVEDVHQAFMHSLAQFLRQKNLVDRSIVGELKF